MRGRRVSAVMTGLCLVCLGLSLRPGIAVMAREGLLVTAVSLWMVRVEIGRNRRPELRQLGVLLVMGLILWRFGGAARMPEYVRGIEEARAALSGVLICALGLVAVPSCLAFYLMTPSRPVVVRNSRVGSQGVARRRPFGTSAEGYKIAV